MILFIYYDDFSDLKTLKKMLMAVFCGHYENWLKMELNKLMHKPKCPMCNELYKRANLWSTGCCGLKLEGEVPFKDVNKNSHLSFLSFMNRLTQHKMFLSWKKQDKYDLSS